MPRIVQMATASRKEPLEPAAVRQPTRAWPDAVKPLPSTPPNRKVHLSIGCIALLKPFSKAGAAEQQWRGNLRQGRSSGEWQWIGGESSRGAGKGIGTIGIRCSFGREPAGGGGSDQQVYPHSPVHISPHLLARLV